MKKTINKALSWLLSVAMLFGVLLIGDVNSIKVNASGGNVAFGGKTVWLEYGPGDYFTDNGKACTDHGTSGIHSATNESACNCKCTYNGTKLGACQCFGYARYIQTVLFGKNSYNSSGSFYKVSGASVSAGSLTADKIKSIIRSGNVKPGAHIRTNSSAHSMVITQITDNGFSIIQANGSNNNEYSGHNACRVGTYTYTWSSYVDSTYGKRGIDYIEMPYDYNIPEPNNYADIGTGFYAYLINVQAWKMAAVVNDNVQLQSENAFRNQIWYFERQSDNSYKITNVATGKCLDVNNGESTNGTNVLVWNSNNNNNQRWYFTSKDGNYVIHPKYNTSIALDVNGGSKDDGTNIQIWETNGSGAQTFCVWKFDNKPNKPTVTSSSKTYAVGSNVKVSWGENAFATSYWVDVWHNGNHTESFGINDTSYTVKSVTAGEYTVFVASCNPNGASETGSFTFNVPTYTISYNMNGGSGSISNQTKNYNQDLTLSSTKPTRTGYTFVGWNTNKDATTAQYQPSSKYTANSGATLYAIWKINTWTVSYNMNGGSGSISNQTKTYGQDLTLSSTKPTRTGYDFVGWNTSASATTAQYQPGGKYTANSGATLYAIWKAKQITVTFYRNQNSSDNTTATQTFTYGASGQSFSDKNWTKDGYTLLGWSFDRNATTATYSILSGVSNDWIKDNSPSKNLYAIWKINTWTVSYNMNGGSGSIDNQTKTYGQDLTLSSTKPTRTGYDFVGWNTNASATTAQYQPGGKYTDNSGATLYAIWKINTWTVSYNMNGGSGSIDNQTKTYGQDLTLSSTKPTRTGYDFVGWNTEASAITAQYQPGGKYTANSGVTLYAVWKENPLKNNSNISAKALKLGTTLTINASATGGTAPYTYAVYTKKSTDKYYKTLRAFSTGTTIRFRPSEAGAYNIRVDAKDADGTKAIRYFTLKVVD